ncbi:MAG: heme ABC transporter ATP-binding protein, partial [Spirochaetae bacterium HGW-Spirochaetae-8]
HREKGKAVLLVSFELDEIFNLSDRIAVMNSGELVDVVETKQTNEEEVGLMMAGVRNKEAAL